MRPTAHTIFIGKALQHLQSVDSTNVQLKAFMEAQGQIVPEGMVLIAEEQTSGRGQRSNEWLASAGLNITMSVLLKPVFLSPMEIFYLNKAVALAVRQTVEEAGVPAMIKWPNDIYAGKKKIAGILIENVLNATRVQYAITGIGINVNESQINPVLINATSLKLETGIHFNLESIVHNLCSCLEKYYLQLRSGHFSDLDKAYHDFLLGWNQECNFVIINKPIKGIVKGVSRTGNLELEMEGVNQEFESGEIKWII